LLFSYLKIFFLRFSTLDYLLKNTFYLYKLAINGIDIVGCGLSQNIKKKLKEKSKEKINLK